MDIHVVQGGFEWVGFSVEDHTTFLQIGHGRIGRVENPLRIEDEVSGGWYFPPHDLDITPTDSKIDILLDTEENELVVMVRSDDPTEVYTERYDLILTLARKVGNEWTVATPVYGERHESSR